MGGGGDVGRKGGARGAEGKKEDTEKLEEWIAKLDQDGDGRVDKGALLASP